MKAATHPYMNGFAYAKGFVPVPSTVDENGKPIKPVEEKKVE